MIPREVGGRILENLAWFPVAGIVGPRQSGKTTLAKSLLAKWGKPTLHLDLELESDLRKLEDPEAFLRFHQEKLVVIDEIQRMPRLFPLLRALVDENRHPGRFLILGSASPGIIRESSETLTGRIAYTELYPISLRELPKDLPLEQHWLKGGFPDPLLMPDSAITWRWQSNFMNTFVERDLRIMGYAVAPEAMRRTLLMLTTAHGNLLNISEISRSLAISAPTLTRYLDMLEGSFMIHRLSPMHANIRKRLVKSPKFYFRDSGVFHGLAGIESLEQLMNHRLLGASWEGYAIEQIRRCLPERWQMSFYRTQAGAETDLILTSPNGNLHQIEIKRTLSTPVGRGFTQVAQDLEPVTRNILVSHGDPFPRSDGSWVYGLRYFLQDVLPGLG